MRLPAAALALAVLVSCGDSGPTAGTCASFVRVTYREQRVRDVFVVDERYDPVDQVTNDGGVTTARLSPDGTRVAYASDGDALEDAASLIHVVGIDSRDPRPITGGPNDFDPDWSRDASTVSYSRTDPTDSEIRTVEPNGSNDLRVYEAREGTVVSSARWSPVDDIIALIEADPFAAGVTQVGARVVVVERDGTVRQRYALGTSVAQGLEWNPDGTSVAVAAHAPDGSVLRVLELASGRVTDVDGTTGTVVLGPWTGDGLLVFHGTTEVVASRWDGNRLLDVEVGGDIDNFYETSVAASACP